MGTMISRYPYAFDDKYFGISRNYHERAVPMAADKAGVAFMGLAAKIFGGEISTVTETLDGRPFDPPTWGRIFQADMYRRGGDVRDAGELREGQSIGHGVVKYSVTRLVPNREIHFTFHRHLAMRGGHAFVIREGAQPDTAVISHEIHAQPVLYMRLVWPFFVRPFHDAVVEDIFDAGLDYLGYPPAKLVSHPVAMRFGSAFLKTRLGQWVWSAASAMSERLDPDWGRNPFNAQGNATRAGIFHGRQIGTWRGKPMTETSAAKARKSPPVAAPTTVRSSGVPSWQSRVLMRTSRIFIKPSLNALISLYGMLVAVGPEGVAKAKWLQTIVYASDYLAMPLRAMKGSSFELLDLPDCPRIEKVVGPGVGRDDVAIVWFHGGGMVAGGFNSHRRLLSRLSVAAKAPVCSVEYRLMIANTYADAVADALSAYRALLETGIDAKKIVIGGDSGGAAVALGVAVAIRDAGLTTPAGMLIVSPWIDFDPTEKIADPRARMDAAIPIVGAWPMSGGMLMATHVLATSVEEAAAISPIRSDLAGLPPFLIHAAETEVLGVDALALLERLTEAGVAAQLKLWTGQIHVFQLAADLVPEGRQSLSELGAFARLVTT